MATNQFKLLLWRSLGEDIKWKDGRRVGLLVRENKLFKLKEQNITE
jgi:hypothetical protein